MTYSHLSSQIGNWSMWKPDKPAPSHRYKQSPNGRLLYQLPGPSFPHWVRNFHPNASKHLTRLICSSHCFLKYSTNRNKISSAELKPSLCCGISNSVPNSCSWIGHSPSMLVMTCTKIWRTSGQLFTLKENCKLTSLECSIVWYCLNPSNMFFLPMWQYPGG